MKFIHVKNYEDLSEQVAEYMLNRFKNKKNINICLASGGSPDKAYDLFVKKVKDKKMDTSELIITKLDEWLGISRESDLSCEKYIKDKVVNPLNIKDKNYISFYPDCENGDEESEKVNTLLNDRVIDLCVLGFGINGHLGLNEPNEYLHPFSHKIALTEETKKHPMLQGKDVNYGMTIGMKNIMDSKEILLLMNGKNKLKLYEEFLMKRISTQLPASFLWLHNNVTVFVRDDEFE